MWVDLNWAGFFFLFFFFFCGSHEGNSLLPVARGDYLYFHCIHCEHTLGVSPPDEVNGLVCSHSSLQWATSQQLQKKVAYQ